MAKDNRKRTWACVVYPESAPSNWKEALREEHVPWYCSPLHDKDINADGSVKKPHWHVILHFAGKQSYETVEEITKSINATRPEPCKDLKGYLRYFAHLDNPEKAPYSVSDIEAYNGADISVLTAPTASERHMYINEMRLYIREHDITEYMDIFDYAAENRSLDWFPLLCDSCTNVIKAYVSSRRHAPKVNPETGEVMYEKSISHTRD